MKKLHLVLVFTLLLFAAIPAAFAQSRVVTGKITDTRGEAVVGATVSVPRTQLSTLTNSDGVLSLSVPENTQRLSVSSIGFAAQEIAISGRNNISIELQASASELNEV